MVSKHKSEPKILAPRNSILFWIAIFTLCLGVTFVVTYHFLQAGDHSALIALEGNGNTASRASKNIR